MRHLERCTCTECLELAAKGANVELLRCSALDVGSPPPSPQPEMPLDPILPAGGAIPCPIQRLQIVPFGLDELSASELEDPDLRAYIWELDDHARHTAHDH